jgi:hypothetical protein
MARTARAGQKQKGINGATLGLEAKVDKAICANLKELSYGE